MRIHIRTRGAAILCATLFLLPLQCLPQQQPAFFTLEHRAPAQMDPGDAALIQKDRRQLAAEAAFFGFDLTAGTWNYTQVLCPDMPGHLLLQYRAQARNGAQSLFTALVPRASGRIQVIPVLYGRATPFQSAAGSPRSLSVFNSAIPADIAARAIQPDGHWLSLAACYLAAAGGPSQILERAGSSVALAQAPVPTIQLSGKNSRSVILFAAVDQPGSCTLWNLALDAKGRVTAASTRKLPSEVVHPAGGREPEERPLPKQAEPKQTTAPQ